MQEVYKVHDDARGGFRYSEEETYSGESFACGCQAKGSLRFELGWAV